MTWRRLDIVISVLLSLVGSDIILHWYVLRRLLSLGLIILVADHWCLLLGLSIVNRWNLIRHLTGLRSVLVRQGRNGMTCWIN